MTNENLKVGDVLVSLDNISVTGINHEQAVKNAINLIKSQQSELEVAKAEIDRLSNLINNSNQELIEDCTCTFRADVVAGSLRRCAACPIQYSIKAPPKPEESN